MNDFTASVKCICIASAAIFLIENLIGGTRLKNQMKLLMKLVFAIVLIYPFAKGGYDLELPEVNSYEYQDFTGISELYSAELIKQTSDNISEVLRRQITASGINCSEIETEVNISEDNVISINRVIITADDFDAAAEIVRNSVGSETEVIDGDN